MPDLKLSKLPDRTPVKITITVAPDLNRALHAYAELYREAYGEAEPVTELIPYMLKSFLDGDRGYANALKHRQSDDANALEASATSPRPRRQHTDSTEASPAT
jgi:hypothetical protein